MVLIEPDGRESEKDIGTPLCGIALTTVKISAEELCKFVEREGRERWIDYRNQVLMTRFAPGCNGIGMTGRNGVPAIRR